MIDPETLTDEQLYVEIHTWERQHTVDLIARVSALQPLYLEAAGRWMADQVEALHRREMLR